MQIYFNGQQRELEARTTIAKLLKQFDLEPRYVAVEVNRELIPREKHAEFQLNDGDRLEVVTLVGGG